MACTIKSGVEKPILFIYRVTAWVIASLLKHRSVQKFFDETFQTKEDMPHVLKTEVSKDLPELVEFLKTDLGLKGCGKL